MYRMMVSVPSPTTIKNCSVYLTSIELNGKDLLAPNKLQLRFSDGDQGKVRDISNGVSEHLDVIRFHEGAIIPTDTPLDSIGVPYLFEDAGDYVLTFTVKGENVAAEPKRLKFKWVGNEEGSQGEASLRAL